MRDDSIEAAAKYKNANLLRDIFDDNPEKNESLPEFFDFFALNFSYKTSNLSNFLNNFYFFLEQKAESIELYETQTVFILKSYYKAFSEMVEKDLFNLNNKEILEALLDLTIAFYNSDTLLDLILKNNEVAKSLFLKFRQKDITIYTEQIKQKLSKVNKISKNLFYDFKKSLVRKPLALIIHNLYESKNFLNKNKIYFSNPKCYLTSIGSCSMGLCEVKEDSCDLLFQFKNKTPSFVTLEEIQELIAATPINGFVFAEYEETLSRIDEGILIYKLQSVCSSEPPVKKVNIFLCNDKYFLANNLLKKIFFDSGNNLSLLHVFFQEILKRFGIKKKIDVTLLMLAFLEEEYELFNNYRTIKSCKVVNWKRKEGKKKYKNETVEVYYFYFKEFVLKELQEKIKLKSLAVSFLHFIRRLVKDKQNCRRCLFSEDYLFNIKKPYKALLKRTSKYVESEYALLQLIRNFESTRNVFYSYEDLISSIELPKD